MKRVCAILARELTFHIDEEALHNTRNTAEGELGSFRIGKEALRATGNTAGRS